MQYMMKTVHFVVSIILFISFVYTARDLSVTINENIDIVEIIKFNKASCLIKEKLKEIFFSDNPYNVFVFKGNQMMYLNTFICDKEDLQKLKICEENYNTDELFPNNFIFADKNGNDIGFKLVRRVVNFSPIPLETSENIIYKNNILKLHFKNLFCLQKNLEFYDKIENSGYVGVAFILNVGYLFFYDLVKNKTCYIKKIEEYIEGINNISPIELFSFFLETGEIEKS
ncbi:hypothetical protein DMUE_1274 [Dictyocoela muelleri]|nr:hypothetical protein DMUE_1274 [Dictyocoela muelleri]